MSLYDSVLSAVGTITGGILGKSRAEKSEEAELEKRSRDLYSSATEALEFSSAQAKEQYPVSRRFFYR